MAGSKRELIVVQRSTAQMMMQAFRETTRDRARAIEKPALACPACGARMRFVGRPATIGAPSALVATCARCAGHGEA
jgi:hypothetical protein